MMAKPVDMSDNFRKNGWEYCKYLITDPRSDRYLRKDDENSKLATPLKEGKEEKS
tara:strand:+ start:543 stop:707 length:165 start_codon:yes stop_codon:yes gene_type:complete